LKQFEDIDSDRHFGTRPNAVGNAVDVHDHVDVLPAAMPPGQASMEETVGPDLLSVREHGPVEHNWLDWGPPVQEDFAEEICVSHGQSDRSTVSLM
jgi:hypothetical protein